MRIKTLSSDCWFGLTRMFALATGLVFLLTGTAKLVSSAGTAPVLNWVDPVLGLETKSVFMLAGGMELLAATYLFLGRHLGRKLWLIGLLATEFVFYRAALWAAGSPRPCSCLGTATEWLNVPPSYVEFALKAFLCAALFGSGSLLVLSPNRQPRAHGITAEPGSAAEAQS